MVAQVASKNGSPSIAYQILICPMTDFSDVYASKIQFASGYFLDRDSLDYFANHYLSDESDKIIPLVSPMKGALAGLPPALILTAECDPLRDEGELYGHKLVEAGVKVTLKRYSGMIHGFYAMTDLFEDGYDVYEEIRKEMQSLDERKGSIGNWED